MTIHGDLGRYPALWAALLALSSAIVVAPNLPVAWPSPPLSVSLATIAAATGLTLLYLGALRFSVFGHPPDLFAGLAFGVLGVTNLLIWILAPTVGTAPFQAELWVYLKLLSRALAAALLTAATLRMPHTVPPSARRAFGLRSLALLTGTGVLGSAVAALAGPFLPPAASEATWQLLAARPIIGETLPGQAPGLLLADGAIAVLLCAAAVGFAARAQADGEFHSHLLAMTLSLLAFSQLHALVFPPLDRDYVSIGDAFRLSGYVLLLCGLVSRMGQEISEHAAREERLRLSRELHDGLAQHLGLLHLRLNLAASEARGPERQARDLQAACRLAEAAMLEARQAVAALRADTVSWDQFRHALGAFADEFGQNHEVEIGLAVDETGRAVDARLQAEVLRILHEAFSNAIRHGGATLVAARVAAEPGALEVQVADNGCGFSPRREQEDAGVGLRSMQERIGNRGGSLAVESAPGRGTRLHARLPLPRASWSRL